MEINREHTAKLLDVNKTFAAEEPRLSLGTVNPDQKYSWKKRRQQAAGSGCFRNMCASNYLSVITLTDVEFVFIKDQY